MVSAIPKRLLAIHYEQAARAYRENLPPERFTETTAQATQRKITLESLDLLSARRSDVQVFNELLVQYQLPRQRRLGHVVPDNMLVRSSQPSNATTNFNLANEAARPFWVLDYFAMSSAGKDYLEDFHKYEQELRVPYYLIFYPDDRELCLYRLKDKKYVSVRPNKEDRYAIRELDLEVGLLDGWVRFWYQNELLPLPADLQRDLDAARQQAEEARRQAAEEKQRADDEAQRAAAERQRADELQRQLEHEQEARRSAERELAQLRALVEQPQGRRGNGSKMSK